MRSKRRRTSAGGESGLFPRMGESLAASIGAKQSLRIRARLAGACQEFADLKYTTIQMNKNYAAKMHVDGNNHGHGPGPRLCLRASRDAGGWR